MRLFRDYEKLPPDMRGCVVALGNFDGVHRGHQAVVEAARQTAIRDGVPLAVLTFEPHPRRFFDPTGAPFRLTPMRAKIRLLARMGVDCVLALPFNLALSRMSAETFVKDVLVNALAARQVVVGHDFVFGHRRRGNVGLLGTMATAHGFGFRAVAPVGDGQAIAYSSTQIRHHLASGEPEKAAAMLGRDWEIEGRVQLGRQLGRTIGVPTANIGLGVHLRPAFGVYACHATIEQPDGSETFRGVANIGRRPTVGGQDDLLEVHLFDFDGDLYGQRLRVGLVDHLRGEERFDGLPALRAQIGRDIDHARRILADGADRSGSWRYDRDAASVPGPAPGSAE